MNLEEILDEIEFKAAKGNGAVFENHSHFNNQ